MMTHKKNYMFLVDVDKTIYKLPLTTFTDGKNYFLFQSEGELIAINKFASFLLDYDLKVLLPSIVNYALKNGEVSP